MPTLSSNSVNGSDPLTGWDEKTITAMKRHLRFQFRYVSPTVRQMAIQQSMEELNPSQGPQALIELVEKKLSV